MSLKRRLSLSGQAWTQRNACHRAKTDPNSTSMCIWSLLRKNWNWHLCKPSLMRLDLAAWRLSKLRKPWSKHRKIWKVRRTKMRSCSKTSISRCKPANKIWLSIAGGARHLSRRTVLRANNSRLKSLGCPSKSKVITNLRHLTLFRTATVEPEPPRDNQAAGSTACDLQRLNRAKWNDWYLIAPEPRPE